MLRGGAFADVTPKDESLKTIQVCQVLFLYIQYIVTYDILNPKCPVVCAFNFFFFFFY